MTIQYIQCDQRALGKEEEQGNRGKNIAEIDRGEKNKNDQLVYRL